MFATQTKSLKALVPAGARLVTRGGGAKELQKYQQLQHAVGISTWDRVRSSMWHPMATMEQSLMDVERMTSQLFSGNMFPSTHNILPRMRTEDDDFFHDLEVNSPKEAPKSGQSKEKEHGHQPQHKQAEKQANSFSSYSFSSSTVLDKQGHHVSTIRRRYEDSAGRLKALHEREIDGMNVKKIWKRKSPDDKGEHRTVTHGASVEEFEEQWKHTPFGQAEKEHEQLCGSDDKQKQVGSEGGQHQSSGGDPKHEKKAKEMAAMQDHPTSAFGMDYSAADAAPAKEQTEHAHGVTDEAKKISRDEAIAQASKTQEEETTPPHFTA
ncbi:hypothetical protein Gpo141_00003113 [Globisporangium polare]